MDLPGIPPTEEEKYWLEREWKDPDESIARIEETAKFLVGAVTAVSGLFAAAWKLTMGEKPPADRLWIAPFVVWALSVAVLLLVLFPTRYPTVKRAPESIRQAVEKARDWKYLCLVIGAILFMGGLGLALFPFQ